MVTLITLISWTWMFANLTGFSEELYRNNNNEISTALLDAMQNPSTSLKKWNIISIWKMDTNVENTFTKWYCTYGAAKISPEFFPYIDSNTQQRTWWGNAVDRCKNAAETGYKIWMTPSQWALIIYDAWGKFWVYWHVGKVMHYEKELNKIIVRDMARIEKSTMSDRWEDITTAQVKCYIYNNKNNNTATEAIVPVTVAQTTTSSSTTSSSIIPSSTTSSSTIPSSTIPSTDIHPVAPLSPTTIETISWWNTSPTITIIPPTTIPSVINPSFTLDKWLDLSLDKINDITKHFISQNDFSFNLLTESPLHIGETAKLILEIINKKTWKKYSGVLPFSFGIISTNDALQANLGNIKFVNEWKTNISILAQKIGTSTIIITMDDIKISEFTLEVQ